MSYGSATFWPALFSSDNTEWATPLEVFRPLDAEFHFSIDVCALPENAKCDRFFTPDHDGLAQQWEGTCWMNPPYGEEIGHWMRKAHDSAVQGATVVCLVPSRTGTAWWHQWAMKASEIRFMRGRIKFVGAESGAPFDSVIVIFRPGQNEPIFKLTTR